MRIVIAVLGVLFCLSAEAKIVSSNIEYKSKDTVMEGYLAYDDSKSGKRPAVLVVHEWTGIGEFVKERCEMLAKLGYIAFAPDIYGKGVRPKAGKEAGEIAGKIKGDRPLMRERILAGFEAVKHMKGVDDQRIAAIGFCFGGTVALELARAGAPLKGVASFHGGLSAPIPAEAGKLKAKVVVFHGAEDPYVPEAEVKEFEAEMRAAKADWSFTKYAHAVHAFSNPHMKGENGKPGFAEYNEAADKRSWASLQDFFKEWFAR